MSESRSNWKITAGLLVCLLAIGAFILTRSKDASGGKDVKSPPSTHSKRESAPENKPEIMDNDAPLADGPIEEAEPPEEALKPDPAVQKLEELNAAGNIAGIKGELKNIAAAGDLPKVEDLLKTWCQEGKPELVRACLDFSKTADPKLHLTLKVESIANPSDEIREAAVDEIEKSTGIQFRDVRHARLWVKTQFKN